MELKTFSGMIEFAVKNEETALAFFSKQPGSEAFTRLKAEAEKHLKNLKKILRENITELVMEPLESLDGTKFDLPPLQENSLPSALAILAKQKEYFLEAARVSNLKEVRRAFEKIAQQKEQLANDLKTA